MKLMAFTKLSSPAVAVSVPVHFEVLNDHAAFVIGVKSVN
jgi:hypothetical protein